MGEGAGRRRSDGRTSDARSPCVEEEGVEASSAAAALTAALAAAVAAARRTLSPRMERIGGLGMEKGAAGAGGGETMSTSMGGSGSPMLSMTIRSVGIWVEEGAGTVGKVGC